MMAPMIATAVHVLAGAFLGAGLGVQLFFSFLVAPAAFRLVDRGPAVRLMEGLFPGYYALGLVTTGIALVLVLMLAIRERRSSRRWGTVALLGVVLLGTVYAGGVLLPQTRTARLRVQAAPAGDLAPLAFSRLHRRAVAVNIALFGVGALALLLHAATPPRLTPS